MQDELLKYYNSELHFLRNMAKDFAAQYPKYASRLLLEENKCDDPHVERLLQGVAFMAARIHRKLDDEFSEVAEALLNVIYPHYLAPIPSMAIVQFEPDQTEVQSTGVQIIPRHAKLDRKLPDGARCRFRTCYPVSLWPLEVVSAQFRNVRDARWPEHDRRLAKCRQRCAALLRLRLRGQAGQTLADLPIEQLRFFLSGEPQLVYPLYDLIFAQTLGVIVHSGAPNDGVEPALLPDGSLHQVGFDRDDGLLPCPNHGFSGYRLLHEYFTFPEKFRFVELDSLRPVLQNEFKNKKRADDKNERDDLVIDFLLEQSPGPELAISEENFKLGCAPIINLFEKDAEPIALDGTRAEYHLIPDRRQPHAFEVYAVKNVKSFSPERNATTPFQPLYSFKHNYHGAAEAFWQASRQPSSRKGDQGTEIYLSLVDLSHRSTPPATETLMVQTLCTNRDLPAQLVFAENRGATNAAPNDFDFEEKISLAARIRCLIKPSPSLRPPLRGASHWRLISHLSLNYLSLTGGESGREALQEILKLYEFTGSPVAQKQIDGIVAVSSRPALRLIDATNGGAFARGMEVTLTLAPENYTGSSWFLFASVLEMFLGLYVSINSFSRLAVTTVERQQNNKPGLYQWKPRAGEQTLL